MTLDPSTIDALRALAEEGEPISRVLERLVRRAAGLPKLDDAPGVVKPKSSKK